MQVSKIIISDKLIEKLNGIDYSIQSWNDLGINNQTDLLEHVKRLVNSYNKKINIVSIDAGNTNDSRNMHTALVTSKFNKIVAYVFFISPGSIARNMFLSQQVFSGLQNIFNNYCIHSSSNDVFNKPVYIINLNDDNSQDSKLVTIRGAKTIGLHYIDLFHRESTKIYTEIEEYDADLKSLASGRNNWFSIDNVNRVIQFQTGSNDLQNATSERYEFLARQIPAVALACNSRYGIDISLVEQNANSETVNSFINYAKKLYNL